MRTGIKVIFVSTGRCGTTRIAEILEKYLPGNCRVVHQTRFSRLANVVGNIRYHFPIGEALGDLLYRKILQAADKEGNFISVDPLSPMIVPRSVISSEKTYIVHLVREPREFAVSMFRLTRKKIYSFIAHNFIPFWQPYLFPLENIMSKNILHKYEKICIEKNNFLARRFSPNPHYTRISMAKIFDNGTLAAMLSRILDEHIEIPEHELLKRTNQTQP